MFTHDDGALMRHALSQLLNGKISMSLGESMKLIAAIKRLEKEPPDAQALIRHGYTRAAIAEWMRADAGARRMVETILNPELVRERLRN